MKDFEAVAREWVSVSGGAPHSWHENGRSDVPLKCIHCGATSMTLSPSPYGCDDADMSESLAALIAREVEAAVKAEREACAQCCDNLFLGDDCNALADKIQVRIRSRGAP